MKRIDKVAFIVFAVSVCGIMNENGDIQIPMAIMAIASILILFVAGKEKRI